MGGIGSSYATSAKPCGSEDWHVTVTLIRRALVAGHCGGPQAGQCCEGHSGDAE